MTGFEIPPIIGILGKVTPHIFGFIQKRRQGKKLANIQTGIKDLSIEISELSNFLREEFNWIDGKLNSITDWFTDEIQREALSGYTYMSDSISINNPDLSAELLNQSYFISTRLINLNPASEILKDGNTKADSLITWGYWGRFIYFLLNNELKYAERQIYICTSQYPLLGINLFPDMFFGEHFKILEKIVAEIQKRVNNDNLDFQNLTILDCADLPSNIQLPLLEIQCEEELDRLKEYCLNKLKE